MNETAQALVEGATAILTIPVAALVAIGIVANWRGLTRKYMYFARNVITFFYGAAVAFLVYAGYQLNRSAYQADARTALYAQIGAGVLVLGLGAWTYRKRTPLKRLRPEGS